MLTNCPAVHSSCPAQNSKCPHEKQLVTRFLYTFISHTRGTYQYYFDRKQVTVLHVMINWKCFSHFSYLHWFHFQGCSHVPWPFAVDSLVDVYNMKARRRSIVVAVKIRTRKATGLSVPVNGKQYPLQKNKQKYFLEFTLLFIFK